MGMEFHFETYHQDQYTSIKQIMWYLKRASPYEQDLLASRKVTSRSSSRSVLLPTIKITMAGLASVLASVSQLARQLNDSLKSLFEPNQMITNMFQKTLIIHQPVSKPGGNVIHQQCPCCPSVITSRHAAKPLLKKVMIFFWVFMFQGRSLQLGFLPGLLCPKFEA